MPNPQAAAPAPGPHARPSGVAVERRSPTPASARSRWRGAHSQNAAARWPASSSGTAPRPHLVVGQARSANGAVASAAAARCRVPPGPRTTTAAPRATSAAGSSAAGSACARLPPRVPRWRIAGWPTQAAAAASNGAAVARAGRELDGPVPDWRPSRSTPPRPGRREAVEAHVVHVDQHVGADRPGDEQGQEALPAGQQPGVAVAGQDLDHLVHRRGGHQVEGRGRRHRSDRTDVVFRVWFPAGRLRRVVEAVHTPLTKRQWTETTARTWARSLGEDGAVRSRRTLGGQLPDTITRRRFLAGGLAGAVLLGGGATILSACGDDDDDSSTAAGAGATAASASSASSSRGSRTSSSPACTSPTTRATSPTTASAHST